MTHAGGAERHWVFGLSAIIIKFPLLKFGTVHSFSKSRFFVRVKLEIFFNFRFVIFMAIFWPFLSIVYLLTKHVILRALDD